MHLQKTPNAFQKAMKDQIGWLLIDNRPDMLFTRNWNPMRPIVEWNNNRIMRNYFMPLIQNMLVEAKEDNNKPKTILSLAIQAYRKTASSSNNLDSTFIDTLVAQLKIFMIAGHDTTATILSYVYYILSTHPEIRDAVRREHEAVFGSDPQEVSAKIKATPTLLNQLPYTAAVIKETLRLYPPFGTIRAGGADFFLTHPDTGERYPTEGMMIFGCSQASQRDEAFWPEPDRCIPERWLVPEGDRLHPRKNAYRPFELGPRNCIGQEMAQLELRMILAMTVREFDIDCEFPPNSPTFEGEVAYGTMKSWQLSPYPPHGMPAKVKIRKN